MFTFPVIEARAEVFAVPGCVGATCCLRAMGLFSPARPSSRFCTRQLFKALGCLIIFERAPEGSSLCRASVLVGAQWQTSTKTGRRLLSGTSCSFAKMVHVARSSLICSPCECGCALVTTCRVRVRGYRPYCSVLIQFSIIHRLHGTSSPVVKFCALAILSVILLVTSTNPHAPCVKTISSCLPFFLVILPFRLPSPSSSAAVLDR